MKLIHQLSQETGIPIHTIRYYEQFGLFSGKKKAGVTSNKYTYYDQDVIERLALIQEAKAIGFTLSEIRNLIENWHGNHLQPAEKIAVLREKIMEIEAKIGHLERVKTLLIEGIEEVEQGLC